VYLTPIFTSPSNHKYDATDFFSIDPMFGGEEALKRLTNALHDREMTLTLDAVLNHCSSQHPWFLAAQAGDAAKRDWFTFKPDGSYLCWQDFGLMPELNLSNPEVRDVLYRKPDSLVQHWLAKGIDSWRFDVAQDVGIPVAQEMRSIVGARFPAANLLGELNGFSGSWFQAGEGFQGMMNYWYRTATLAWLAGDIDAVQMNHAVRDARAGYGLQGLLCSWNMLSSHDTPRLITSVGDAERARLALLMQFTLPGVPLVYYGEEIGMEGGADPDCRRTMRWNEAEWNHEQRAWVKRLIAIRQTNPALQYGDITVLGDRLAGNALVFLRHTTVPGEEALVIVNMDDKPPNQWDAELLQALDIPASLLPTVKPSSALYGEVAPDLLGHAIPIGGVAGDQQSALFGQACFKAGMVKNTYGTGCFMLMHTGGNFQTSHNGLITTSAAQTAPTPEFAIEGSVFVGGAVVQWLRDGLHAVLCP
jgi:glycosidase